MNEKNEPRLLDLTLTQRGRRTIEMVVGVSLGVLIGDVLVALIGQGTWQIAPAASKAPTTAVPRAPVPPVTTTGRSR